MKRVLTFTLILSLSCIMVYAQSNTLDIKFLSTPPTIDGDEADWPNDIPIVDCEITINKVEPIVSQDPRKFSSADFPFNDLAAYFRVAWDNDNLYLFVNVDDDVLGSADATYKTDNIEFFFNCDLGNDLPYTGPNDGTDGGSNSNYTGSDGVRDALQIRFPRDTVNNLNRIDPNWVVRYWGVEWVVDNKPTSYTLEAAIPLDSLFSDHMDIGGFIPDATPLFYQPENGLEIGFEIMVTDDDNTASTNDGALARDGHVVWANESGNDIAYLNTELFGTATFTGQPTSVKDFDAKNIRVFPGVVNTVMQVEGTKWGSSLIIFDVVGSKVYSRQNLSESNTIDMHSLLPGMYIVSIYNGNSLVTSYKIIKE